MKPCEELYDLLIKDVIPDVQSVLAKMSEYSKDNEITDEMREEQNNLIAVHENFLNIQNAIESKDIDIKNCEDILNELSVIRQMDADAV